MNYTGIDRIRPARRKKKLLPHRRALPGPEADQSMTASTLVQPKTAEIFRGID
jgi:hypothetical protein